MPNTHRSARQKAQPTSERGAARQRKTHTPTVRAPRRQSALPITTRGAAPLENYYQAAGQR